MEIVLFFSSIKSIKDVLNAAVIRHPVVSCIIRRQTEIEPTALIQLHSVVLQKQKERKTVDSSTSKQ